MDFRSAPTNRVLMRAGVQFNRLFPSLPMLTAVFCVKQKFGEDVHQQGCFKHTDAPGRIFALGLRGNCSDIKPLQRKRSRCSGVEESGEKEFGK